MSPRDPEETFPPEAPSTIPAPPPDMALVGQVLGPTVQGPMSFTVPADFDGFASDVLDEED